MVWNEGDFFTCRDCGAQLEVKRQGTKRLPNGPFYPSCPWCGRAMDIVNVIQEPGPSEYMGGMKPAEEGDF